MKNAPRDKMFRGASQTVEKARKVKETSGEKA